MANAICVRHAPTQAFSERFHKMLTDKFNSQIKFDQSNKIGFKLKKFINFYYILTCMLHVRCA